MRIAPHSRRPLLATAGLLLALSWLSSCADGRSSAAPPQGYRDLSKATPATYLAHGSVEQVWVEDAAPGALLDLVRGDGLVVQSLAADDNGSLIFRRVESGANYRVATGPDESPEASAPFAVTTPQDVPDGSFYDDQRVDPGYGYIETRDGTLLAISVYLPGPPENGPYPTVIEYSGYDPANPDSKQPSTLFATTLGYAAVGINMRGTGCSGGAFDFFETLQSTDGYDAVEIIARQPWVKGNKVGMVGISYPGISQLFTAQYRPPSLAAIAPLSVISDTGRGTLYPGGILNNGFATDWSAERQRDAKPGGQAWSRKRLEAGDPICIENMKLRDQTPDLQQAIRDNDFYHPEVADPLSPITFVGQIDVPVFLAGAWQDEQTGGYFGTMLDRFTGTDRVHLTLTNGNHTDSIGPLVFTRWWEFLEFYVAEKIPELPLAGQLLIPGTAAAIFGLTDVPIEADRFADSPSYADALARYESEPRVRVLLESGAGDPAHPGSPVPTADLYFSAWPIPGLVPTAWYFDEGGLLSPTPPSGGGADSYLYDPSRAQLTTYTGSGGGIWLVLPPWNWQQPEEGTLVAYATEPLDESLLMIGSGSVDLWLGSTARDVDLQVTLSEVRPDGTEYYVQSGWLRASHRALDEAESTELRPVQSHREEDAADLPQGELTLTRVEIFPFAHAFHAGSRIRLSVETPGGSRPLWKFEVLQPAGDVMNTIGRSAATPSRVVLPVVPGVAVPEAAPVCPSLRGQPCRTYVEIENAPAS